MSRFDAVLFDMDNTLHSLREARFCAADGIMAYKGCFPDLHFYSLNRDNPNLVRQSLTDFFQENNLEGIEECIWLYQQLEISCLRPFIPVIELVWKLKGEGKKLAIVSNADIRSSAIRIRELGLEYCFDLIVTPETFGVKKPDIRVYLKTLEVLGVSPDRAVMIGDTASRDIIPAREAGLTAIHAWFGTVEEKDPLLYAENPEDVSRILETL
ncbi:MAG TPA: HAD family hydrolase [Methanocorpusculum sp.]|nr:HAD family hydrolase [Methanocorpusculum sp.]HJJ40435.1 HAD family hydrolase [Methanocorpusculum sp.]HJJ56891.1 HAD family hydrolase [Methanocorpusculum sp.]